MEAQSKDILSFNFLALISLKMIKTLTHNQFIIHCNWFDSVIQICELFQSIIVVLQQ